MKILLAAGIAGILGVVVLYAWGRGVRQSPAAIGDSAVSTPSNDTASRSSTEKILVAGGCFWCVEADLEKLPGVVEVVSGYAGGTEPNPTYETYHDSGHREVAEVEYNPREVTPEIIWIYAIKHMDPTDGSGSFHDRGEYYSPALYYRTEEEKEAIEALLTEIDEHGPYDKPLASAVEATPPFYRAEEYHQNYYKGTLSALKYKYYRNASGRDEFIKKYWGTDTGPTLPWRGNSSMVGDTATVATTATAFWATYRKPDAATLEAEMSSLAFEVTQEEGTEKAGSSPLNEEHRPGIFVDLLSGEPLYSSRDKFDSGTGWPSFVQPITPTAVTEHEDRKLFVTRTEIRSRVADNHLGHVFSDGPADRGGLRYCMNGVALRFVPREEMEREGYGAYIQYVE